MAHFKVSAFYPADYNIHLDGCMGFHKNSTDCYGTRSFILTANQAKSLIKALQEAVDVVDHLSHQTWTVPKPKEVPPTSDLPRWARGCTDAK